MGRSRDTSTSANSLHTENLSEHDRKVADVLYSEIEKEIARWNGYASLVTFLSFLGLILAVLYLQSHASIAYQVHASISSITPSTTTMSSRDAVLEWLRTTLEMIWKDPICGDGICAEPYEFASYGRFGCRADCGKLPEVQNVTTLVIDLRFDFHHPTNSVPSAELMSQASWNLCPTLGAPHGSDCYFQEMQKFDTISGDVQITIDDIPDGQWEIRMKRDFFNKVKGAVRRLDGMKEQSEWDRKYGAFIAAVTEQDYEIKVLEDAIAIGTTTAYDFTIQISQSEFAAQYDAIMEDRENGEIDVVTFDVANATLHEEKTFFESQYAKSVCQCDSSFFEKECEDPSIGDFDPEYDENGDPLSSSKICEKYVMKTQSAIDQRLETVRSKLILDRLGDSDGRGSKLEIRASRKAEHRFYVANHKPELYDWIFENVDGTRPELDSNLTNTKYDVLAKYFSDGPTGYLDPTTLTASNRLTAPEIESANLLDLISRSQDRIVEIGNQKAEVRSLAPVNKMIKKYKSIPDGEFPNFVNYNHVQWNGGADAYLTCHLETRAPEYSGTCRSKIDCQRIENTDPYTCPPSAKLDQGQCGKQCSYQEDCIALCKCDGGCGVSSFCECKSCELLPDPFETSEYRSLQELVETVSPAKRKLQQESSNDTTAEYLLELANEVNALRLGQVDLESQIVSLENEVETANALAQQREEDNSLEELISTGLQEMSENQNVVETLLIEIIGKQNQTLEAVEEATRTIQTLEELTLKSLEAQNAIQVALREQMNAIKIAYSQNLITLDQASELWRLARRERLVSEKEAYLASYRCSSEIVSLYSFQIDNYEEQENVHSRERFIGLSNRVIAGMLVHTTRSIPIRNSRSRFEDVQFDSRQGLSISSYGVDPVFKSGTSLYNPDFDDEEDTVHYYNCSKFENPTYNILDPASEGMIVNSEPFCAELFNARSMPFGFRHFDLKGKEKGFPFLFDINLSEKEAQRWYTFMEEGLYLDGNTKMLTAEMVVYNGELDVFGFIEILFHFADGGSIQITRQINTARIDLYQTKNDGIRLGLEILLVAFVFGVTLSDLRIFFLVRSKIPLRKRIFSIGVLLDFTSDAVLILCILLWWNHVYSHIMPFDVNIRYDVYESMYPMAAYLTYSDEGSGLKALQHDFEKMKSLVQSLSLYYAMNGLSILLLIARMLKRMDFQPRLGVVTRSIALAGSDLVHFSIVASLVFVGYAMMTHLIFGSFIEAFSTFANSVNTCFEILLGDVSIASQLKELSGLQAAAGTLFFWSFEILVFLILLNFLLAIIVDAFSAVKENTTESIGIHRELFGMFWRKWIHFKCWLRDPTFVSYDRLGPLLHHYGTPTSQTESNLNKIQIGEETIDRRGLRSILRCCYEDPRFRGLIRSGPCFWRSPIKDLSDTDLDQIVTSILQRIGTESSIKDPIDEDDDMTKRIFEIVSKWEEELEQARDGLQSSLKKLIELQTQVLNRQRVEYL